MRVVAALGGSGLLLRGDTPDADIQETRVIQAAEALAALVASHEVIITHGNGPQVGLLAHESAGDLALSRPYPFDVLGAQTQGMIGYWIMQAIQNATGRPVACLICRTVVNANDPAFASPTKSVGPVYDEKYARRLIGTPGWNLYYDGSEWRRVVPSPEPVELVEIEQIRVLAASGVTVVCSGGGGIPVVRDSSGRLRGARAVIDKDLTAALLARETGADALLLLTDVASVLDDYGTPQSRPLRHVTSRELRARSFPAGSMRPKVEAACRFAETTGGICAIGRLGDAEALLDGRAGTIVSA